MEKQGRANTIRLPRRPPEASILTISVVIDSPSLDLGSPWDDLVGRASSNVFMNPAALAAACETDFAKVKMLLAWDERAGARKLVGVWALRLRKMAPFWPVVLEALPYNYAFLSS